jgi:putative SOS response-associated peptidase YedK
MCYYNGTKVTKQEYIRLKHLEKLVSNYKFLSTPYYDGFAYGQVPVLKRQVASEDFDITQMEWGFIPDSKSFPFLKTRKQVENFRRGYTDDRGKYHKGYTTLNAVSEELLDVNKWYRDAALHRRCIALSSGFYDWKHIHPIGKRGQPLKTTEAFPYRVRMKGPELFYIAGIWQPWTDTESGEYVESLAFVTTKANSFMSQVHNLKERMPTMLTEELAWDWVFGNLTEQEITTIARSQIPSEKLEGYTIDKKFKTAEDPTVPFNYNNPELVISI